VRDDTSQTTPLSEAPGKPSKTTASSYYQSVKEEFQAWLGDISPEDVPNITESKEIWGLLSDDPDTHISPDDGEEPVIINVGLGCTWDKEHGHYVKFEDDMVDMVDMVISIGHLD